MFRIYFLSKKINNIVQKVNQNIIENKRMSVKEYTVQNTFLNVQTPVTHLCHIQTVEGAKHHQTRSH